MNTLTKFLCQAVIMCCAFSIALSAFAAACDAAVHRAFDCWLGEWQVHMPDGKLAGTDLITSEYGGCVIHEHYSTGRGYSG